MPEYDVVVEIKPVNMVEFNENCEKIHEGMLNYSLWLVTEEELFEENNFYEHILSF